MIDLSGISTVVDDFSQLRAAIAPLVSADVLDQLDEMTSRVREKRVVVAAFGETNSGKSSLLNAIAGEDVFSANERINHWSDEIERDNCYSWKNVDGFDIVLRDTPGIDGDFKGHMHIAKRIADEADLILYVVHNAIKGEKQVSALRALLNMNTPIIITLNKGDIVKDKEREAIIKDVIEKFPEIDVSQFIITKASPMYGETDVDELIGRIGVVVTTEREELVHRTLDRLCAGAARLATEEMSRRREEEENRLSAEIRRKEESIAGSLERSQGTIKAHAKWAAGIAAALPFGFDAITSSVAVVSMLRSVANAHGVEMDASTLGRMAKELVQGFVGVLFTSATTLAAYKALTVGAKTNPLTYMAGMALDGALTYFIVTAIGNAFSFFCANKMSWGAKGSAARFFADWTRDNIDTFIGKLPERFRDKALSSLNKDLLR